MKLYKKILFISAAALSVAACKNNLFSQHVACDDEAALTLVNQILKDDLDKSLERELKTLIGGGDIKDLDPAKLKLSAQNINFSLTDSRTEFVDPNSPKTTCSIDLAAAIPSDLLKKSDEARAKVDRHSTETQAADLGLAIENSKINLTLEYTLQPTDKGDKVLALIKNTENLNSFLSDTLTYAFLKPQIEKNEIRIKEAQKKAALAPVYDATASAEAADAAAEATYAAAQEAENYEDY